MDKTIGERTAETILETPRVIEVHGRSFEVAPPTCATLIAFSALIPEIPYVDGMGKRIEEALASAKDTAPLFRQVAILIKGARALKERPWYARLFRREETVDELAEWLMDNCSPSEMNKLRDELLTMMEIADFFVFSVSLQEISLIQATRETAKTIRYGQS